MASYEDYNSYRSGLKTNADGSLGTNREHEDGQRLMKGIFGGPIGWYEAATGKNVLSQELTGFVGDQIAYGEMNDEDVFNSMSTEDWKAFNKMNGGERQQFVAARKKRIGPEADAAREAKIQAELDKKKEADFQKWRHDTMLRLDAFSKEMGMPVEELIRRGDLGVTNAGNNARTQAGSAAYGAGLTGGGVSSMNTQRAVTDAQAKYQLQRQGLGLQATDSLLGNMGQMSRDNEGIRQYEQGMNLQLQNAREQANQRSFAEGQGRQSSMFGLAGGVIGGIYGGTAGASAGYQLGSGLGASTYGQYRPTQFTYPRGSSRPGSGGLTGGRTNNPYGGSQ